MESLSLCQVIIACLVWFEPGTLYYAYFLKQLQDRNFQNCANSFAKPPLGLICYGVNLSRLLFSPTLNCGKKNPHTHIIHHLTFLKCLWLLSIFTMFCNYHYYQFSEYFQHTKRKTYIIKQSLAISLTLNP